MSVRLYTTEQAAERLAVTAHFLKRGATAGVLPHTRVGRFIRWSESDLERVVEIGKRDVITRRSA